MRARHDDHGVQGRAAQRSQAFRAAGRHSTRVIVLRRAILAIAFLGTIAVVWIGVFNPFASSIPEISIKGSNLDGTRVTMEQPRLAGFRKDGRPYEVIAATGVQDVRQPNLIELSNLNARIGMLDQSVVQVVSGSGLYDSLREFMDFKSAVRIKSPSYDIDMRSAKMDFKAGTVSTQEDVKVLISAGEIFAERMNITENGQNISFEGNVRSSFEAADSTGSAAKDGRQ